MHPQGTTCKITRMCPHCGVTFERYPSQIGTYCSRRCGTLARGLRNRGPAQPYRPCQWCGALSLTTPGAHYCSRACVYAAQRGRRGPSVRRLVPVTCPCGTVFQPQKAASKYCSRACGWRFKAHPKRVKVRRFACIECGQPVETYSPMARYCSAACGYASRHKRAVKRFTCLQCGEQFAPPRPRGSQVLKYCSPACGWAAQRHDGWYDSGGYRVFKIDGRKIQEHRYVMEQHLGRQLRREEAVHHINGVRDDNRLENLQLMTHAEHSRLTNQQTRTALAVYRYLREHQPATLEEVIAALAARAP